MMSFQASAEVPPARSQDPDDPSVVRRPRGLLVGFGRDEAAALAEALALDVELLRVSDEAALVEHLAHPRVAVVCLGAGVPGVEAGRLLDRCREARPSRPPLVLVFAAELEPGLVQEAAGADPLFFLSRRPPEPCDQAALIEAAVRHHRRSRVPVEGPKESAGRRLRDPEVRDLLDRLPLQTEAGDLAELLADAARIVARADRAACLLHDPVDDALWAPDPRHGGEQRGSAASGLAAFVLRTGRPVCRERPAADPRFDPELDDPEGDGEGSLVAVPVPGPGGEAVGVLVAVRGPAAPALDAVAAEALELLARLASPHLVRHRPDPGGEAAREPVPSPGGAARVFRREALEAWSETAQEHGDPLALAAPWLRWGFRLLLAGLLVLALTLLFGRVDSRTAGPAVVRAAPGTGPTLTILLPEEVRPLLRPGLAGRFRPAGAAPAPLPLEVVAVRPGVVSAGEARDLLGSGDGMLSGDHVAVEARLTGRVPETEGGEPSLDDGTRGTAEVVVRRERAITTLLPGLRAASGGADG